MKQIVRIIATSVIVLAAVGMIAYKYSDYIKYPWTRDGTVRAQVIQIVPRLSGELVRVPIRNNQLVKKGDLLFEIDPSTFQANVNLARAQLDNMHDIIKSLAEQVDVMSAGVAQSESDRNQARFVVEGYAANTENARVEMERTKTLLSEGVTDQRDYDNKNATYLQDLAQLNGAKSQVNQMTAELERSKAALARAIADLGALGEANPRL